MILNPVEVVGRGPKVISPLVSYDELGPEHGQIQGLDGMVLMN